MQITASRHCRCQVHIAPPLANLLSNKYLHQHLIRLCGIVGPKIDFTIWSVVNYGIYIRDAFTLLKSSSFEWPL